jgi:hypothetical protein
MKKDCSQSAVLLHEFCSVTAVKAQYNHGQGPDVAQDV